MKQPAYNLSTIEVGLACMTDGRMPGIKTPDGTIMRLHACDKMPQVENIL